eukprot:6368997-Prymnesium_polylepis.1
MSCPGHSDAPFRKIRSASAYSLPLTPAAQHARARASVFATTTPSHAWEQHAALQCAARVPVRLLAASSRLTNGAKLEPRLR